MAHVAIVEAYPYEAVWGGDAVYLDRIRLFLTSRGHRVESYVTDVTRGRASPLVRLHSEARGNHRWIVRRALGWRADRFVAFEPRLMAKAAARLFGRRALPERAVHDREQRWVAGKLAASPPDLVILTFGACRFARAIGAMDLPVLAIRGFFSDRIVRLGQPTREPSPDPATLDELRDATRIGFNNLLDLAHYERATGAGNGALVSMGFPRNASAPASGEPIVLFVGARTKPNIEAITWFIEGAWPLILAAVPAARLRIVGAVGAAIAPATEAAIEIAGFVDNIAAEYHAAQLVVAPLTFGSSGVKTKVAEALSYGRPLVTTSIGVDPADPGQFGEAVDVADDPRAFADAVIRLLTDASLRANRTSMATVQFDRHFAEEAAYAPLIEMLATAARVG